MPKPSERIKEIFTEIKHPNISMEFSTEVDAVIQYLDEVYEKKNPVCRDCEVSVFGACAKHS